ncbi:MAG TPA: hypothetical protein ENJ90_12145 [Devosia sp.]|nr:hypothetical protein [Devosia sp.]
MAGHLKKTSGANAQSPWLSTQQVAALLTPGAVWCSEPEAGACLFKAVSEGALAPKGGNRFSRDAIELWDEITLLSVPAKGDPHADGLLWETARIAFEDILGTRRDGDPVSQACFAEVQAELTEAWRPGKGRQFCFRCVRKFPDRPELISQYLYGGGGPVGGPLSFTLGPKRVGVAGFGLLF